MTDEYAAVKKRKLVLKGEKPKAKKRKHKKGDKEDVAKVDEDCMRHGGWWRVTAAEEITGSIAIEFGRNTYVSALDNGLFTIGAPHDDGDGPSPEEIFTAFPAGDNKFALKSGYGKYLGVTKDGTVVGRSDAVGPMEQWEPVFQDGRAAILSALNKFVSVEEADDALVARLAGADERAHCAVRSSRARPPAPSAAAPGAPADCAEDAGDLAALELNYVKKFQKFQDKKVLVAAGGAAALAAARARGELHGALLERRARMKADRYCK
ncbi:PREDICTED: protein FRG1 homolog [Papilio polytes]|uniref:protein FRG1 homolog n=1 Tax=Papilio polytes TaxID=76194 RepID=UPI0006763646|nr:PREDICTED: protein FRG1 homolog [Papilio polytes]